MLTITNAERKGEINHDPALNFIALVLFGAYTGQRIIATMKQLKVGQSKGVLGMETSRSGGLSGKIRFACNTVVRRILVLGERVSEFYVAGWMMKRPLNIQLSSGG